MGKRGTSGRLTRRFMLGALMGGAAGAALGNAPTSSIRPGPRAADFQKRTAPPVEGDGAVRRQAYRKGRPASAETAMIPKKSA